MAERLLVTLSAPSVHLKIFRIQEGPVQQDPRQAADPDPAELQLRRRAGQEVGLRPGGDRRQRHHDREQDAHAGTG